MNAGILIQPTRTPFKRPQTAPKARQNSSVSTIEPVALNATTAKPATIASMEPTERSISPVRHTRPMPMAMVPITAEWRNTFMSAPTVRPLLANAYTARITQNTIT